MVNWWKELVETWQIDGVTIVGAPFMVWKESGQIPQRCDKTQPVSKLHDHVINATALRNELLKRNLTVNYKVKLNYSVKLRYSDRAVTLIEDSAR